MAVSHDEMSLLFKSLMFAAERHTEQRRKDVNSTPYINHPIEVANIIVNVGEIHDPVTIVAALLHDTIEDTNTTESEIEEHFGQAVAGLVAEVTDDKSLPRHQRKRLQVETAAGKSLSARVIKIADKTSNVKQIAHAPPKNWSTREMHEYLDWSSEVVNRIRGTNRLLEEYYDLVVSQTRKQLMSGTRK